MRIVRSILIAVSILSLGLFGISELVRINGRDTEAPVITSDREVLEIPCGYTQEQLMEGLSAEDGTDGDLTPGDHSRVIFPVYRYRSVQSYLCSVRLLGSAGKPDQESEIYGLSSAQVHTD